MYKTEEKELMPVFLKDINIASYVNEYPSWRFNVLLFYDVVLLLNTSQHISFELLLVRHLLNSFVQLPLIHCIWTAAHGGGSRGCGCGHCRSRRSLAVPRSRAWYRNGTWALRNEAELPHLLGQNNPGPATIALVPNMGPVLFCMGFPARWEQGDHPCLALSWALEVSP